MSTPAILVTTEHSLHLGACPVAAAELVALPARFRSPKPRRCFTSRSDTRTRRAHVRSRLLPYQAAASSRCRSSTTTPASPWRRNSSPGAALGWGGAFLQTLARVATMPNDRAAVVAAAIRQILVDAQSRTKCSRGMSSIYATSSPITSGKSRLIGRFTMHEPYPIAPQSAHHARPASRLSRPGAGST